MGNALRQTVDEPEDSGTGEAGAPLPERMAASSPVHDLHDMLVQRLSPQSDAPAALASQARMSIMFWIAIAAWSVVLLGAYAIAMLF